MSLAGSLPLKTSELLKLTADLMTYWVTSFKDLWAALDKLLIFV